MPLSIQHPVLCKPRPLLYTVGFERSTSPHRENLSAVRTARQRTHYHNYVSCSTTLDPFSVGAHCMPGHCTACGVQHRPVSYGHMNAFA